ncbi:MAG: hypothetical protein ACRDYA_17345 [Egibacteraceae bacterium]
MSPRIGWIAYVALPLMLMFMAGAAFAQESELGGKVRSGNEVIVPAGETVSNDLYVFGRRIRIEGRVEGDLTAFGGEVDVSGPVTGDVLVGAGTTTISGQVDGDVRVGSGQAMVPGSVGEDLLVGAGRVTIVSGARVLGWEVISSSAPGG